MCRVESLTNRAYRDVLRELRGRRRPRTITVRAFLAASLIDPAETSLDQAGAILKDIGGVPIVRRAVRAAAKGRVA